jgi:WD40 repeat protein
LIVRARRAEDVRLKVGRGEPFEQPLWRGDESPHLLVDTGEAAARCWGVAWSPDDSALAAVTTGGIKVWTLRPRPAMRTVRLEGCEAELAVFSPDGRWLAAGASDGTLVVWDVASGRRRWSWPAHPEGWLALRFGPGRDTIVSVGAMGTVAAWTLADAERTDLTAAGDGELACAAIDAAARRVALGAEGRLTVLDLPRKTRRTHDLPRGAWVASAAFSARGSRLAAGGSDGVLRLWPLGAAGPPRRIARPFARPARPDASPGRIGHDQIQSVAWSGDDALLAAGGGDGTVALWKTRPRLSLLDWFPAHTAGVAALAFSHEGRLLATCGGLDRIVKLWSLGRRAVERLTLIAIAGDDWAAVTPDERYDGSAGGLEALSWVSGTRAPVPVRRGGARPPERGLLKSLFLRSPGTGRPAAPVTLPEPEPPDAAATEAEPPPAAVLTVRTRPSHRVCRVAWSPDETFLAAGTEDGNIDVWDRATGRELRTLHGHENAVTALLFVGKDLLASGAEDGTVRIWSLRTGRTLHVVRVRAPEGGVAITRATAEGVIICAGDDGTVRWLHLETRARVNTARILMERPGGTTRLIEQVAVRADGLAVRPYDRDQVAVFDLRSGRLCYEFRSDDTPGSVAFDGAGQVFAVGGATSRQMVVLGGGGGAGEFPRDTYAVDVRESETGRHVARHLGHRGNVVALAFSPDGRTLASGSLDGTARLWEAGRKEPRVLQPRADQVNALAFNGDGSLLATGEGAGPFLGSVTVWDAGTGKPVQRFERHIGDVHPVRFSPDGTMLAAAGEDGIVWLWRLRSGEPPALIRAHRDRIFSLAFSPDGRRLATASWDGTSRLWDTGSRELAGTLDDVKVKVWSAVFAPGGATLATGCDDGRVSVWDAATGRLVRRLGVDGAAHGGPVIGLAYSPDGRWLASGGLEGSLELWDTADGAPRGGLGASPGRVFSLDFNRDGTLLASGDWDQEIALWDLRTGGSRTLKGHARPGHVEKGTSVRFRPDGTCLASGGTDGTVRLWDVAKGASLGVGQGHAGPIASVDFNRDGTLLAAGSNDASASLWDVRDPAAPAKVCSLYSFPDGTWAVVDARGRFDAASGGDVEWLHWVVGLEAIALRQLKERYYEPNLLPKLLGADAEPLREVPTLTEVELHPAVEVVAVEARGRRARLRVTDRGGGIGRVVVSINGKEAEADARGAHPDPQAPVQDILVDVSGHPFLKPGKNACEVRAYNAAGYLVGRDFGWACQAPRAAARAPHLWVIVAGVSDYQGDELDLRFAAKDAEDFAAAARLAGERLYGEERVHLSLLAAPPGARAGPGWPTRRNLERAFAEARSATSSDVLVVYLAGHGVNHGGQDGDYFYLTADARTGNLVDPAVRQQTAISSRELAEWIRRIPALKQAVILDTCAAGRFVEKLGEVRSVPANQARALERLKDRMGTYVLAGSSADAVSYESSRYGQGLLTYSVLFGMRGAALREDEFVDVARLFEHAADLVPQLATGLGGIQRPLVAAPRAGGSFDIGSLDRAGRERIPLALLRPVLLAVQVEEADTWKDTLDLTRRINAALREASARPQAPLLFVDAREHPDAYVLRGRYRVEKGGVTVALKLFAPGQAEIPFEQAGSAGAVEALAGALADRTVDAVAAHFSAGRA